MHWLQNRSAEQPLKRGLWCKTLCSQVCTSWLVAVEFAQLCAVEFVCTTLWVRSWACKLDCMQWSALLVCWRRTVHTIVLFCAVQFSILDFVKLSLETLCTVQWIALPMCWRCTPVNQWKKSAKNLKWIICRSKVQGFRTRGHVNRTTPSDQVYPCLSLWWRVEHYMLLIWIEMDIVGSVCLLSLFLLVQETTQEEVVVNPTTPSDQAHPCLFLWWQVKRHRPRAFWMDYLSSIWMRMDVVCCICLLSLLLIAGWSHLAQEICCAVNNWPLQYLCFKLCSVHSTLASMWVELVAKLYLCYCPNLLRAAGSSILVWLEAIQSGN